MRISTSTIYRHTNSMLNKKNTELNKAQDRLISGRRVSRPSDDPSAIGSIIQFKTLLATNEQYITNSEYAQYSLTQQESTIALMHDSLNEGLELYIQGINDTKTVSEKKMLANQLSTGAKHIANLVNTQDNQGYIFNGAKTRTKPIDVISDVASGISGNQIMYNGEPAKNLLPGTIDGEGVLFKLDYNKGTVISGNLPANTKISFIKENTLGNTKKKIPISSSAEVETEVTYTEFKDIFSSLITAGEDLINNEGKNAIDILKGSMDKLQTIGTNISSNLNYVEDTQRYVTEHSLVIRDRLSKLEDVDYAEAINDYNFSKLTRDVALQTIPRLIQPTLIDFIG
jgi:flagellar hook-associated protein 3 FlgL